MESSIVIPKNVESIGAFAFNQCSGLTSIIVEEGNKNFDSRNNCNAIIKTATNELRFGCNSTIIPNSVKSISSYALYCCTGIKDCIIPNGVETVGDAAFSGCDSILSIIFPNSLKSIGAKAFGGCKNLKTITIPKSLVSIGGSAFAGCSDLISIKVEKDNTTYDSRSNCNAIIKTETNELITGCRNTIIPDDVVSIGTSAFFDISGLQTISIPNNVTSIDSYAFSYCDDLSTITLPTRLTSLGSCAFEQCKRLKSVSFPNSLKSIGVDVFKDCEKLSQIYSHIENIYEVTFDETWGKYELFDGIPEDCLWHVPVGTSKDYMSQPWWVSTWQIKEDVSQFD